MVEIKFKDILRKTREEKNLSQKELSEKLRIPVSTYRNYENTSRQPDYDTLVKIANILNVSVDYLLGNYNRQGRYAEIISKLSTLPDSYLRDVENFIEFTCYMNSK